MDVPPSVVLNYFLVSYGDSCLGSREWWYNNPSCRIRNIWERKYREANMLWRSTEVWTCVGPLGIRLLYSIVENFSRVVIGLASSNIQRTPPTSPPVTMSKRSLHLHQRNPAI